MGRIRLRGAKIAGAIVTAVPRNIRERTGLNRLLKSGLSEKGRRIAKDKWDTIVGGKKPRKRRTRRR